MFRMRNTDSVWGRKHGLAVAVLLLAGSLGVADDPPPVKITEAKPLFTLKGHDSWVNSLAYSLDGTRLFTAGGRTICEWDLATGKKVREVVQGKQFIHQAAFSADRKMIAYVENVRAGIILIEAANGKELRRLKTTEERASFFYMAFSPCGKLLVATASNPDRVHVWEVSSGKELHVLQPHTEGIHCVVFSADGQVLATASNDGTVCLSDVRTGKVLRRLPQPFEGRSVDGLALSPRGDVLATAYHLTPNIFLWDASTGKKMKELPVTGSARDERKRPIDPDLGRVAFSPDGRVLAVVGNSGEEFFVGLWEIATGKEGTRWRVRASSIAFAPDGKSLATGIADEKDRSALVWDRAALCRGTEKTDTRLTASDVNAHWDDLSREDPARAFRAVWSLTAAASQALERVELYLKQLTPADPSLLQGAIADLDHPRFQVRDKALRTLEAAGARARPVLVKALTGKLSPEPRKRIETLLEKTNDPLNPERLHHLRLVETLEHIGSPPARRILEKIADGALGETAAKNAKGTLDRLAKYRPEQ